jgi:hypothetical protein
MIKAFNRNFKIQKSYPPQFLEGGLAPGGGVGVSGVGRRIHKGYNSTGRNIGTRWFISTCIDLKLVNVLVNYIKKKHCYNQTT